MRQNHCTSDGEIADKMIPSIDEDVATEEERCDGFYAVCTNLEDDVATIISIKENKRSEMAQLRRLWALDSFTTVKDGSIIFTM